MYCNKCGNFFERGTVCPVCGEIQNAQPVKSVSMAGGGTKKKKKKSKKWAVIAVICSLISIFLSLSEPEPPEVSVDNSRTTNAVYFPQYDFSDLTEGTTESGVVGDSVPSVPSSPDSDITRTIMVYMVGSDLETNYSAATYDLMEMVNAQYDTSKINVVVCAGGAKQWNNNIVSASETSYYLVTDESLSKVKTNPTKNMGLSSTLSEFLTWCKSTYSTDRYSLILWNHGGGPIYGYGHDEVGSDMLSLSELVTALSSSPFNAYNKLETLGFDACLMGTVETAWVFKDYAEYYIASQEVEPGNGWDYEFLSKLSTCKNGGEMGSLIIDYYFDFYEAQFSYAPQLETEITLSCLDLSKIDEVEQAVNTLFSSVNSDVLAGQMATASRCRYSSKAFGKYATTTSYDLIDLKHIANLLAPYYSQANALASAVDSAVVCSKSNVANANGLSIYHPYDNISQASAINTIYGNFRFAPVYAEYIKNFMSNMAASSATQTAYRGFSDTAGTSVSKGQQSDISVQLTEEQMATFSSAQYYVFWEMPADETFSKKTEYLQIFSGQDVTLNETGMLTATYDGKAVFGKNGATGRYSDCPLSMYQIYDGTLEEKYYFPCMFWYFGEDLDMDIENVNWLMKIKDGKANLLNAYLMESANDANFPDKQLVSPDDFTVYGFMNNAYFVSEDSEGNTVFEFSGSSYGYEYTKEDGFSIELRPIEDKSEYRAVFVIEDIYGNRYFSDFIPLA